MHELEQIRETEPREPVVDPELFARGFQQLPSVLRRLAFKELREGQKNAIYSVLGGVDTLCIMPTSGGKSAVFIIPALCHKWKTLVFCPLKSLMRDQVKKLQHLGIAAFELSSDKSAGENDHALSAWVNGECEILYIAPERLRNEAFRNALKMQPPDFLTVDEAHVLAQWTDSFRHSYTYIADIINIFKPRVVIGLTATFNEHIEKDVRRVLGLPKAKKIVHYHERSNLKLSSSFLDSDQDLVDKVLECQGKTLVYCGTKKLCEKMAAKLSAVLREEVGFYHSEVNEAVKKQYQDRFASGKLRVICATNAFGMGVDIPDIRAVIHYLHPGDPEAAEQESGRGGRDGKDTFCHMFESRYGRDLQEKFIEGGNPQRIHFEKMYSVMKRAADADGVFHLSGGDLAEHSGVSENYHMAIAQTMQGARVIEEARGIVVPHQVALKREPEAKEGMVKADVHYARFHEFVRRNGTLIKGAYVFDLNQLSEHIGIAHTTMRGHLNTWHHQGDITYTPPPRAKPKRIIGNLETIDFERLALKREDAFKKLEYLLNYFKIPDAEKHAYMRAYFERTAGT